MYYLYLIIWIVLVSILFLLFRYLAPKIKESENTKTRQSLFALLMFISIPLIFVVTIGPIIILAGDPGMPVKIKYLFIAIALIVVFLFRLLRRKH